MIFYKIYFSIRDVWGIVRSTILEKHIKLIQLYEYGFRCIKKGGINNRKVHLRLLEEFHNTLVGSKTGKMDGYPLEESLGADFGYEKGAPNGRLDGNGYTKREKYPLK